MARGQTQSLACAPPEAELQRYTQKPNEDDFEHYTNIARIAFLAGERPLVSSSDVHKPGKALDNSLFNANGRAVKFHQSPHDLKLTLAASGATIIVGVTVNCIAEILISVWYIPGSQTTGNAAQFMEAVFLDIAEAAHWKPPDIPQHFWKARNTPPLESGGFETTLGVSTTSTF